MTDPEQSTEPAAERGDTGELRQLAEEGSQTAAEVLAELEDG